MPASTSSRTTSPKRRRRSSASTASSRSSASSETSKSASRVTRKKPWSTISMPGKSASRWAAMTSSSGTKRVVAVADLRRSAAASPWAPSRGRTSSCCVCGSRTRTASDSERLEMYGNGRPSPTASGVSTGKIWRRKRSSSAARSSRGDARRARRCAMPCSASCGRSSRSTQRVWRSLSARRCARGAVDRLLTARGRRRRGSSTPGVDLVVQPGDADHEELVEVRGEDRGELHALQQRRRPRPRRAAARGR